MNNSKNLLIAVLTGLLALSLFTQPAQSASKTYDAVKLAQYSMCLNGTANFQNALMHANGGNGSINPSQIIRGCKFYLP
jgi:hypothetical protein